MAQNSKVYSEDINILDLLSSYNITNNKLIDAIDDGNIKILKYDYEKTIINAIDNNDIDSIKSYLDSNNITDNIINAAIVKCNPDIICLLLNNNIQIKKDYLINAIKTNNQKIVKIFLNTNQNLEVLNINYNLEDDKILKNGISINNLEIVELLLNYGFNVNANNGSIIKHALKFTNRYTSRRNTVEMMKLLIDKGADINKTEFLISACETCNSDLLKLFLESGIDPDLNNGYALIDACKNLDLDKVKLLLNAGADPNINSGKPLITTINKYYDTISYHRYNYLDNIENGIQIINMLIEFNADINIDNSKPLITLLENNYSFIKPVDTKLLELFLTNNIDIKICNNPEIIDIISRCNIEIVKTFTSLGIKINPDIGLMDAIIERDYDLVKLLIELGADVNLNNGAPLSNAIKYCKSKKSIKILKLLYKSGASNESYEYESEDSNLSSDYSESD